MKSSTLGLLSAMITPAVLIMASSSLILATSQRLSRLMDRARKINDDFKKVDAQRLITQMENDLYEILSYTLKRGRILQKVLSLLYIALAFFIATSASIGIVDLAHARAVWFPIILGVTGVVLLLFCSFMLIIESQVAIRSVEREAQIILTLNKRFFLKRDHRKWFKRKESLHEKTQK